MDSKSGAGTLFVGVMAGLMLAACTGTGSPNRFYAAHSYSCCAELGANTTWHRGQQLALHWTAEPQGMTADDTRHQIVLKLSLTGPFPSVDALKQAISQGSHPAGVKTIASQPVTVNDRTFDTPVSTLDLPPDLAPGYYNLGTESARAGLTVAGSAVVIIAP
jgi:hypothetical protein